VKSPGYPNIERFAHLVDRGLGLVFALIRMGVFLVAALILVALIAV
jgi:hypothetical protein